MRVVFTIGRYGVLFVSGIFRLLLAGLKLLLKQRRSPTIQSSPQAPPTDPQKTSPFPASSAVAAGRSETPQVAAPLTNRWIPPGERITLGRFTLEAGFIYIGETLPSIGNPEQLEPALIQPSLAIAKAYGPQDLGRSEAIAPTPSETRSPENWDDLPLSCRYSQLTPSQRAIYLDWLATGRQQPAVPAPLLRLFLSGVERRLLHDLPGQARQVEELLSILLELERLQRIYPEHGNDLTQLIDLTQIQLALACQPETLVALLPATDDLCPALKVALGQCIQACRPIPGALAWAWYRNQIGVNTLRTPAKRCPQEFARLFQLRYTANPMVVAPETLRPLPLTYRPLSPSFRLSEDALDGPEIELVTTLDISDGAEALRVLDPLLNRCTEELEAYSRCLGRNPELAESLLASSQLPTDLLQEFEQPALVQLRTWLAQTLADQPVAQITGADLLAQWPTSKGDRLLKKEAEACSQCLEKLGYGLIPDVRFGDKPIQPQRSVLLYRQTVTPGNTLSPAFERLQLLSLILVTLLKMETGANHPSQIAAIWHGFQAPPALDERLDWEQERLAALQWGWQRAPLPAKTVLTQIRNYDPFDRPIMLAQLQQLFMGASLSAAQQNWFSRILEQAEPARERPPVGGDPRPTIDETAPCSPPSRELVLDSALIAQRQQDSMQAAGVLADIFTEEEDRPAIAVVRKTAWGLDAAHLDLVMILQEQESWSRADLEAKATPLGLMLDGALENINEVAFDHWDEPLTEGEDQIVVNESILAEFLIAEAA
jgi:hypothetical protein